MRDSLTRHIMVSFLVLGLTYGIITSALGTDTNQNVNIVKAQLDGYTFWKFENLNNTIKYRNDVLFDVGPSTSNHLFWDPLLNKAIFNQEINKSEISNFPLVSPFGSTNLPDGASIAAIVTPPPPACQDSVGVSISMWPLMGRRNPFMLLLVLLLLKKRITAASQSFKPMT